MGLRTEPDTLFVYRDNFANARFSAAKPAGVACTEYRKVKEHPAKGGQAPEEAAKPAAKKRAVPRLLDRAKSPAVKKSK